MTAIILAPNSMHPIPYTLMWHSTLGFFFFFFLLLVSSPRPSTIFLSLPPSAEPVVLAGKGSDPRPTWLGNDQIPTNRPGKGRIPSNRPALSPSPSPALSSSPFSFADRKREKEEEERERERERERVSILKKKKKKSDVEIPHQGVKKWV